MLIEGRFIRKPLSRQVRDQLREMIRSGSFQESGQLPSEEALVSMFGVSRGTVREALKTLEEEHLVVCRRGRGRFLAGDPARILNEDVNRLQSVTEMVQNMGLDLQTEVLSLEKKPADDLARSYLDLQAGEKVFILERARRLNSQIVIYSIDVFPEKLARTDLTRDDFKGSLLQIIEGQWNVKLVYARTAISANLLDAATCRRLGVDCLSSWLLLEQVTYDEKDRPILYSKDYHLSELIRFHLTRRRG